MLRLTAMPPTWPSLPQFGDPVELLQMVVNVERLPGPRW